MSIIGTVAQSLQTALGTALDAIGRRTGIIRRQRKFTDATLFNMVVLTLLKSPKVQTHDFVARATQLGVTVTRVAQTPQTLSGPPALLCWIGPFDTGASRSIVAELLMFQSLLCWTGPFDSHRPRRRTRRGQRFNPYCAGSVPSTSRPAS